MPRFFILNNFAALHLYTFRAIYHCNADVTSACNPVADSVAQKMDSEKHEDPGHNPYSEANFVSKTLFWY